MKKIILMIIVLTCLPSFSFGYMESRLFCRVNQQAIKVSTSAKDGSKCKSYIAYLEQTMRQTAREVFTIQGYINNKQDVDYWTQIKKQKLASIDTLQGLRLDIIASVKSFELALLRKSVDYFTLRVAPYKLQLTKSLATLSQLTGNQTAEKLKLTLMMSGQVQTLDKIAKAQTFEELIPLLNGYIYFQQQIAGKSE